MILIDSTSRPAWVQNDLCAHKHLHRFGGVVQNYFVKTHGFIEGNRNEISKDGEQRRNPVLFQNVGKTHSV
jgi:hypothetical protein